MKNLKVNRNFGKKFALCSLIGTISGFTFIGCGKNDVGFLENTILEEAVVVTFEDGTKQVAERIGFCNFLECKKEEEHMMYKDLISKEYFSDVDCDNKTYPDLSNKHYISKYSIINEEGIIKYLTIEEVEKAGSEGLSDSDIIKIITRVKENNQENIKEKVIK